MLEQRPGLVAVVRLEDLVPVALEIADDDLADDWLVVDYENGCHGAHCGGSVLQRDELR